MANCKILIVDDEAPARRRLLELIADIQAECPCQVVGEASSGRAALDMLAQLAPDIILLDVQMPSMTGLEFVEQMATYNFRQRPSVIFVTAYDEFAFKAFQVHVQDYLLKPVRASRLLEALQRVSLQRSYEVKATSAAEVSLPRSATADSPNSSASLDSDSVGNTDRNIAQPTRRTSFSILERNRVLLVPVADVLFLKAEQKYLTVHTKSRNYLLEESLSAIEHEMADRLVRVHRNALVARDAIIGVERATQPVDGEHDAEKSSDAWQVIVRDSQERLPISRRQWPTIKALVR